MKASKIAVWFGIGMLAVSVFAQRDTKPEVPPFATVEGAVNSPGRVQFPPGRSLTIVDAISLAGGPARLADLKRVWLMRANAKGELEKTVVDVDALIKGRGREAPGLRAGDRIVVIGVDVDE